MTEIFSNLTTSVDERPMFNGGERPTSMIDMIVLHHNATTSKNVALNTWTIAANNYTSAHYEITDNEIIGAVGENYIAYHAGGTGGADTPKIANPNGRSIGLEHVNSSGAPDWAVSDATIRNSAKLVADICGRYGIPIDRNHIVLHREVTSTQCPGGLDADKLVRYAQEYANNGTVSETPVNTQPVQPTTPVSPQPQSSTPSITSFQENNNEFTAYGSFSVDEVSEVNGIPQLINYKLAGGQNFDWTSNGIPWGIVNNLSRPNNENVQAGDIVELDENNNHGTIDEYDVATNGVGIVFGEYGEIWFDADALINL